MDQFSEKITETKPSFRQKMGYFSKNILEITRNYASENPIFFFFILLMLPITLLAVQQTVNYLSKAQTAPSANLFFTPSQVSLPPDQNLKIMLDSGTNRIAFARVSINFDASKVSLASTVSTNPNLSTVVEKTDPAAANSQGKAVFVIAASPTDSQPQGSFELASFTLSAVSSNPNDSTAISFNIADMQIVESTGSELTVNPASTTITLNGNQTTPAGMTPTPVPAIDAAACLGQSLPTESCYLLWKNEYSLLQTTKDSDLDNNGIIDLVDFEFWRRAALP